MGGQACPFDAERDDEGIEGVKSGPLETSLDFQPTLP